MRVWERKCENHAKCVKLGRPESTIPLYSYFLVTLYLCKTWNIILKTGNPYIFPVLQIQVGIRQCRPKCQIQRSCGRLFFPTWTLQNHEFRRQLKEENLLIFLYMLGFSFVLILVDLSFMWLYQDGFRTTSTKIVAGLKNASICSNSIHLMFFLLVSYALLWKCSLNYRNA